MNSSIINSLLSEDKQLCMYVYFNHNNIEMCAPLVNINEIDSEYIAAQDILLESIVILEKDNIIRYNYNTRDCDYEEFITSHQYLEIKSKLDYIQYHKDLFNSSTPITTFDYCSVNVEDLDQYCLVNSLDVKVDELDIINHPKIELVCQQYRADLEDNFLIKVWEAVAKIDNNTILEVARNNDLKLAMQILEENDALDAAEYIQEISADLATGDTTPEFLSTLHARVAPTASRLRGIEQSITSRLFPTLRKFLYKAPHLSPRKLFCFYRYKLDI
jgi:hypothetical protein